MHLVVKISTCMICIVIFGNILAFPLLGHECDKITRGGRSLRVRRQDPVVQPSWITDPAISLFEDFNVRVTNRKLEETEAIREHIQETVDNGTYVVELDEGDFEEDTSKTEEVSTPFELPEPEPELKVETEPEPDQETQAEPRQEPQPEPEPKLQPEPQPEPQPAQEPTPKEKQIDKVNSPKKKNIFKKIKFSTRSEPCQPPFHGWFKKMFSSCLKEK